MARLAFQLMALHFFAETAFDDLLTAWRQHCDVRSSSGVTVEEIGAARSTLDGARDRMHRLRSALYPNADERSVVVTTALCPRLDEVVYLSWLHRDARRPGNLRCPCGDLVPIP